MKSSPKDHKILTAKICVGNLISAYFMVMLVGGFEFVSFSAQAGTASLSSSSAAASASSSLTTADGRSYEKLTDAEADGLSDLEYDRWFKWKIQQKKTEILAAQKRADENHEKFIEAQKRLEENTEKAIRSELLKNQSGLILSILKAQVNPSLQKEIHQNFLSNDFGLSKNPILSDFCADFREHGYPLKPEHLIKIAIWNETL